MTAPMKSEREIVWPAIGSRWVDSTGRALIVSEVRPSDGRDRNIVGKVNGESYATSIAIFEAIWKPAP